MSCRRSVVLKRIFLTATSHPELVSGSVYTLEHTSYEIRSGLQVDPEINSG